MMMRGRLAAVSPQGIIWRSLAAERGRASEAEKFKADLLRCVQEGDSKGSMKLLDEMKKKEVEINAQR